MPLVLLILAHAIQQQIQSILVQQMLHTDVQMDFAQLQLWHVRHKLFRPTAQVPLLSNVQMATV